MTWSSFVGVALSLFGTSASLGCQSAVPPAAPRRAMVNRAPAAKIDGTALRESVVRAPARPGAPGKRSVPDPETSGWVRSVVAQVAKHRHWEPIPAPSIEWATTSNLKGLLEAELDVQLPRAVSRAQDEVWSMLGLLPPGYDSTAASLEALAGSIQGAYLPARGVIALRYGLPAQQLASTVTHEVAHAYADWLYGLRKRLVYRSGEGDRIAALHALAEGDAMRVEVEVARAAGATISDEDVLYRLGSSGSDLPLPGVLRRAMTSTYVDGYRLVSYLQRTGGWQLVDLVWRRGLESTSELLHPERWVNSNGLEPPRLRVVESSLLERGAVANVSELLFEDCLGEQGLRNLLEEVEPGAAASVLASAWSGDRISLVRQHGATRLVWHLRVRLAEQLGELSNGLRGFFRRGWVVPAACQRILGGTVALQAQGQDIWVAVGAVSDASGRSGFDAECAELTNWLRSR